MCHDDCSESTNYNLSLLVSCSHMVWFNYSAFVYAFRRTVCNVKKALELISKLTSYEMIT